MGSVRAPCPVPAPCPAPLRVPRSFRFDLHPHGFPTACALPHPGACRRAQQLQQATVADRVHCNMCNIRSTFATSRRNIYNICPDSWNTCNIHLKHEGNTCVAITKHMQHICEIICNIGIKQHKCNTQIKHVQHSSETAETFGQTLAIYVYSHCNICNIQIYFCNIHKKHLQHAFKTPETFETYACNMRLQHPRKEGSARCSRINPFRV
jgi:hypothetical protein